MNVEIGTEASQFSEKEYMNAIFVAVHNHPLLQQSLIDTVHRDMKG